MWGTFVLIMVPELLFLVTTGLYAFIYHHSHELVWLLVLGLVALSVTFMAMETSGRFGGGWYMFLGMLSLVAILAGNICGMYIYSEYFMQYWAYDQNRSYSNVLPSEPAAAHADAGKIEFAPTARIDTTKAVGYKSGAVYCVAPVMDETQTSRVEYWAAGVDCCKQRADFGCGQADVPTAHSGVVILDANSWFSTNHDFYKLAVKQAEAQYDIVSAPEPIFVQWVDNPAEVEDEFWLKGWSGFIMCGAFYIIPAVVFGLFCGFASKRRAGKDPRPAV
jgi:hypothetical protein